jgi:hypothetical protein
VPDGAKLGPPAEVLQVMRDQLGRLRQVYPPDDPRDGVVSVGHVQHPARLAQVVEHLDHHGAVESHLGSLRLEVVRHEITVQGVYSQLLPGIAHRAHSLGQLLPPERASGLPVVLM